MRITIEEIGGRGQSGQPYEAQELMAVVLARALHDGETVGTGAASAIARAACRLAQVLHAPNLTFIAGGSGAVNPFLEPLTPSSCDYANLICDAVLPMPDLLTGLGIGNVDVFIYGGLQLDRFGNVNLSLIGDPDKPKLRGPGGAALALMTNARRSFIFLTDHSKKTLVEKVDFITAPGYLHGGDSWRNAKKSGKIKGNGPALVVTPLAVMDFEDESKALRLVSIHPGVSLEQVQAATGFELIIPAEVAVTRPPSINELQILRTIDANRLLRVH